MQRYLLIAVLLPATAFAQDAAYGPALARHGDFEHLPLLYEGPDPTTEPFLWSAPLPAMAPPFSPPPPPSEVLTETFIGPDEMAPGWVSEPLIGPPPKLAEYEPIPEHKDGFFQKVSFSTAWIDRGRLDGFGITEFDLNASFALPAPTREWPLVLTPAFNVRLLDGPNSPDLPPRLYETYLDFMWLPRVSPRWVGIVAVAPSLYSDFEVDDSDAWRLTGKGLARFDWVPERLQLLFGVLYLNREDVRLLPAGGLIWIPGPDRRYELVFPRPKLARRIKCGPGLEDWMYLGSEFGGNSFAFERAGTPDIVTLRDYRLFFGLERKRGRGAGHRIEIGYIFSRKAEFSSGIPDAKSPSTAFLRAGASF